MIVLNILLILCSIHPLVNGVGFRGLNFEGLKEPVSLKKDADKVDEGWITQRLDHFNPSDNRTWSMRFKENSAYLTNNSCTLIMIGGEWMIDDGFLQAGLMYEIGEKHKCMMYYTEHRFYGKSMPTTDINTKNLQYLSADQALADLAHFIRTKKKEKNLKNNVVIVFGCSYAGNLAAYARLKYPNLIKGALASSGPVHAKADFYEYNEVVAKSISKSSQNCVRNIKTAFTSIENLFEKTEGPQKLQQDLKLCNEPDTKSLSGRGYLMQNFIGRFGGIVQYNKVEANGKTSIDNMCQSIMENNTLGTPLQRLSFMGSSNGCNNVDYNNFVRSFKQTSWGSYAATSTIRQWIHQTCWEFGYFQTTNSNKSIFGTHNQLPLDYSIKMCKDLYGQRLTKTEMELRVTQTNIKYGNNLPSAENIIYTNGDIDPWHALSVTKTQNKNSPAILIKGGSHCSDIYNTLPTDSQSVKQARITVRSIIDKWISS